MSIHGQLYLREQELPVLVRHCSNTRYVWDIALEQCNCWRYRRLQKITYNTQVKELTQAYKDTWLKEGSSTIQQQTLRGLNQSFQNEWNRPDHFCSPTWRKTSINKGFTIEDLSVRRINYKWGDIETASSVHVILANSSRWFVNFTHLTPQIEDKSTGVTVGIDMGVTHTSISL